ncbi:hypothetical protein RRG08_046161 [Elysia crispata]|uniref:Uncharacterized protein n=1 Tax=Elysia crispata TaxID=231223 RepID=A0AAE0XNW9_9GAST|nr:hypothetical protein RRG08_046161 [Elysia crispata]
MKAESSKPTISLAKIVNSCHTADLRTPSFSFRTFRSPSETVEASARKSEYYRYSPLNIANVGSGASTAQPVTFCIRQGSASLVSQHILPLQMLALQRRCVFCGDTKENKE